MGELLERADAGDRGCLPDVQALLPDPDEGPGFRKSVGSSAEWLRQSIIKKSVGANVLGEEAVDQELASRGLDTLVRAGLVSATRRPGRTPAVVMILDAATGDG
jgi:hypothetical protein